MLVDVDIADVVEFEDCASAPTARRIEIMQAFIVRVLEVKRWRHERKSARDPTTSYGHHGPVDSPTYSTLPASVTAHSRASQGLPELADTDA